jgi:hypothetical protein
MKMTLYKYTNVNAIVWMPSKVLYVETPEGTYTHKQYKRGTFSKNGTVFRVYSLDVSFVPFPPKAR